MPSTTKIGRIFSMEWGSALQYRADIVLWMIAETLVPILSLAVWHTVSLARTSGPGPQETITYYLLIMLIRILTSAWGGMFLVRSILNGEIVKDLVKPVWPFWKLIANNICEKTLKLLLPILVIGSFIVWNSDLVSPNVFIPTNLLLGLLSLVLAVVVSFALDIVMGFFAFWLEDAFQIRRYAFMMESIASGLLIPFAVMPDLAKTLLSFLPFRYTLSLPAELFLGQLDTPAIIAAFGAQLAWATGLVVIGMYMWRAGLKRYAVPGQ
ncbi:MAG: ABC-2 family transporter protein [Candidatus Andersenbacteria bacterium]